MESIQNKLTLMRRHIRRKVLRKLSWQGVNVDWQWMTGEWSDGIEKEMKKGTWENAWDSRAESRPEVLQEEIISKYNKELQQYVVSHVDKHVGEGLIM